MREALKLALDALTYSGLKPDGIFDVDKQAITTIKEALAQPEQEPVAWMDVHQPWDLYKNKPQLDAVPLYTTPPKQEPRNFCPRCGKRTADLTVIHTCTPPRGLEMT